MFLGVTDIIIITRITVQTPPELLFTRADAEMKDRRLCDDCTRTL